MWLRLVVNSIDCRLPTSIIEAAASMSPVKFTMVPRTSMLATLGPWVASTSRNPAPLSSCVAIRAHLAGCRASPLLRGKLGNWGCCFGLYVCVCVCEKNWNNEECTNNRENKDTQHRRSTSLLSPIYVNRTHVVHPTAPKHRHETPKSTYAQVRATSRANPPPLEHVLHQSKALQRLLLHRPARQRRRRVRVEVSRHLVSLSHRQDSKSVRRSGKAATLNANPESRTGMV